MYGFLPHEQVSYELMLCKQLMAFRDTVWARKARVAELEVLKETEKRLYGA